jgi:hypothetical protein
MTVFTTIVASFTFNVDLRNLACATKFSIKREFLVKEIRDTLPALQINWNDALASSQI